MAWMKAAPNGAPQLDASNRRKDTQLDASKNHSRIGGELIQSVVSEEERGQGGMDPRVFRC